jgi:hypothetical protein
VTKPRTVSDPAVQKGAWWQPLRDHFDGPGFSPLGGLYYRDNFEQRAGTIEFQREVRLTGSGALKLTVRPIAGAAGSGHSERAEIWERTDLWAPYGQGIWYGFAVRFAEPIPEDDHRYLIAQWKREILPGAEGDFSPFLALRLTNSKLYATVETNYVAKSVAAAAAGAVPTFLRPAVNQMRALVAVDDRWTSADARLFSGGSKALDIEDHGNPLPRPSSGWIEFTIFAKPGPEGDGRIEIIANGKPVVTVKGPIGHADKGLGPRQYFKFGPYRASHAGEWTLYYDHFRRSPDRRDVVG